MYLSGQSGLCQVSYTTVNVSRSSFGTKPGTTCVVDILNFGVAKNAMQWSIHIDFQNSPISIIYSGMQICSLMGITFGLLSFINLVFSTLILSPVYSSVSLIALITPVVSSIRYISSTYANSVWSPPSGRRASTVSSFLTIHSKTMLNNFGNIASPCLSPDSISNGLDL